MMLYEKSLRVGLVLAVLTGTALFDHAAFGQDAAWEGLINAGRNALQQRKFSEAERHFESALEAAERFPSGDARLGKSYNNLAAVYYAQEDYERAEPLMRRALAQLREAIGPENTEVAQTMKNLAALYYLQGNRSEAEALLKQSLTILENVHGPNHAFVATVLSNLAGLYQAENRYQDAEPLLTRSIRIWESLLGSDHPDVVRSRDLLEKVRLAQGGAPAPPEPEPEASEPEVAAVQPSEPRPLIVPREDAAADQPEASPDNNESDDIARATEALEQLARQSNAALADPSATTGIPAPALNPINGVTGVDTDVAILGGEEPAPSADATGGPGDGLSPSAIVAPVLGPADESRNRTAAIVNDTPSSNEVSFSVYLSTLWSIDEARRYWRAIKDALPEVLEGKKLEIEEVAAVDGDDPFYRVLTIPFPSDADARAACDQIKAKLRTHDCDVVVRGNTADG